jgi:cyclopropane fatty-acyl-phospholipid synthase-like methyltransferase
MPDSGSDARYSALHSLDSPASRLIRDTIWGRENDIGQQSFTTPRYVDQLITRLGITVETRVLDVGSGVGGPAVYIAERTGCRVAGIDVNEVGVTTARRLADSAGVGHLVEFHLADAMQMPFPDGGFDVAISLNVMNVFPDKLGLFREVRRVLAPGGVWAFLSGTFRSLDEQSARALSRGGQVPQHFDSLEGYLDTLRGAGFQVDEITEYVSDFRVQIGRWRDAYREHAAQIAAEQGEENAALHHGYFDTYARLIDEGRASNHLVISSRPA